MELIIRNAIIQDADSIVECESKTFEEARSRAQIEEAINCNNGFKQIIAAESNGVMVGYVWREYSEIIAIAVDENLRNKGIASAMLKKLTSDCNELFLEVRESNAKAISLYNKLGFFKIAIRDKYYPNGENAIVMRYAAL